VTADEAASVAARILSRGMVRPVILQDIETLSDGARRNLVLRAVAASKGEAARSVIVKATRDESFDPASANAFRAFGLVREWAAASLLARRARGRGHGAAFLGGDAAGGVMVFADLGRDLPSLVHPLLHGTAAEAERALIAHAAALGRLHADTAHCREDHRAALHAAFPAADPPGRAEDWAARVPPAVAALLGGSLPDEELSLIAQRVASPEPWLALVHGDPCPDNTLFVADAAVLIDHEFSRPGHALFDAVTARMGFPTCWCAGTLPADTVIRIETTYRREAAAGIAAARDDDAFRIEMAMISAATMFDALEWQLEPTLTEDSIWGIASRRSRTLHHLETVIRDTEAVGVLPHVRALAAEWLDRLHGAWPNSSSLALYPAFTRAEAAA
jgi:hypothetical protein